MNILKKVKDNLDIEKLFRDKFEHFEGNVNPQVWTNLSAVVNGGAKVAARTGMSALTKAIIIGAAAVVSTVVIVGVLRTDDTETRVVTESVEPIVESVLLTDVAEDIETPVANIDAKIEPESTEPVADSEEPIVIDEPEVIDENNEDPGFIANAQVTELVDTQGTDDVDANTEDPDQELVETAMTESHEADDDETKNDDEAVVMATSKLEYKQNLDNCLEVEFKSNGENYKSIEWHLGDGTVSYDPEPVHLYNDYGEYTVILIVENPDGSTRSEIQTIQVVPVSSIKVYNVFTPNNDNTNDFYSVETQNIKSFSIAIYDFNNRLLFRSQDANFKWHGYDLKGNRVPKGDYYYGVIAEGKDGVVHKREGQLSIK